MRALPILRVCFFLFTSLTHSQNLRAEGNCGDPRCLRGRSAGEETKAQFFRAAERSGACRVQERGAPSGLRAPPPGPARARRSASAGTQPRLLGRSPREAPPSPGAALRRPSPYAGQHPAPGLGQPGASRGCGRNKFARSLREPTASYLAGSSRGRSPTQSGPRAPGPQLTAAEPRGAGRTDAPSPARGRTVAGLVRGGRRHVTREAGDAGSGGPASGPVPRPPQRERNRGAALRRGWECRGRETRRETHGASDSAMSSLWEDVSGLYCVAPKGAEIESVGGNCRDACWGQFKEASSNHQSCL